MKLLLPIVGALCLVSCSNTNSSTDNPATVLPDASNSDSSISDSPSTDSNISEASASDAEASTTPSYALDLQFARINQEGLDPVQVTAVLTKNGAMLSGQTLGLTVPKGALSSVSDHGDGRYGFTVTPTSTGDLSLPGLG